MITFDGEGKFGKLVCIQPYSVYHEATKTYDVIIQSWMMQTISGCAMLIIVVFL
jgi:hypothetical protein